MYGFIDWVTELSSLHLTWLIGYTVWYAIIIAWGIFNKWTLLGYIGPFLIWSIWLGFLLTMGWIFGSLLVKALVVGLPHVHPLVIIVPIAVVLLVVVANASDANERSKG